MRTPSAAAFQTDPKAAPTDAGAGSLPRAAWNERDRDDMMPEVMLAASDLIADTNGEVVLFNDGAFSVVEFAASASLIAEGIAGPHVTAAGDDVGGFRFLSFSDGLTLYFDPALKVIVRRASS